jgi:peptide/nickel transport system substrate-binding protein
LVDYTVVQGSVQAGDPHICSDGNARNNLVYSVYEALISQDGGGFRPCLARSWAVEPDGLTWSFQLREGVRFHNGDRLKASDVTASLRRIIDPKIGGAYGTQGVYAGYIGDAEFTTPRVDVVRIRTREPMADLLDLLSEMPIGPEADLDRLPGEYVGTGPYLVGKMSRDEVVLEPFRGHWSGAPRVGEVTWLAEPDALQRARMVLDRDVDLGCMVGAEGKELVESEGGTVVTLDSGLCIIFLLNCFKGSCVDRRVRQALNHGLDARKIIGNVKGGEARQLNGYLTPHHFGYDPDTPLFSHDADRARRLLSEAGYGGGLRLVMDVPTSMPDEAPRLASELEGQYAEIGVEAGTIQHGDRPAYSEMVRGKRIHDLCCFDSSPRSTFRVLREKLHSGIRGPWWMGYSNPEVDRLIGEAQRTFDDAARKLVYRRIYRVVTADAPWLFLYRPNYHWAVGKRLEGWSPDPGGLVRIR